MHFLSHRYHQQTVGNDCERCHTPSSWIVKDITQIHNQNRFPLHGRHAQIDCYQCHKSASLLRFDPLRTECVACHINDYLATTNPSHVTSKFPKDCLLCHNEINWQSATFNHDNTAFHLKGAHVRLDCIRCHSNGYVAIPTICISCHLANYNATTNLNHTIAKFPTTCETCHSATAWVPSTFNHSTSTAFPLTEAHNGVTCIICHPWSFSAIPITCVSCHLVAYNSITNPNHVAAKFPTTCETFHTTKTWVPSTFNHSISNSFPLTGAHIGLAFTLCHPTNYGSIPTTCVSCHLSTYNATTSPNHITAKFLTICETCHSTTNWTSSTFNHDTSTAFPLTGAHIGLACTLCHPSNYNAIPTTCVSCHLATYNPTTTPSHTGAKFGTACETCHSTSNWTSSTFNHATVSTVLLTGNHNLTCTICHTNPANYAVFSCITAACHKSAHNQSSGSTGCYSCHPNGRAD